MMSRLINDDPVCNREQRVTFIPSLNKADAEVDAAHLEKRNPLSMFVLWAVMQANYVNLYIGITAAKSGGSTQTALLAFAVATFFYTCYGMIAGMNGATTGKRLVQLADIEFGKIGGIFAGLLIIIVPAAWYCFNCIVAADVIALLLPSFASFKVTIALGLITAMSVNNLFGFTGILNFAQYLAAPILILGTLVAFLSGSLVSQAPSDVPISSAFDFLLLQSLSIQLIGNATWGNEEDFWRYAKPTVKQCLVPIFLSNFIGLFTVATLGYFGASFLSATSDMEALKEVALIMGFGIPGIAAVLSAMHMVAINDSNLFSTLNGAERFFKAKRPFLALCALPILLVTGYVFSQIPLMNLLFCIAGICGTVLPCLGLIVWCSRTYAGHLPVPLRKNIAIIAVATALTVGLLTSPPNSLIPGVGFNIGIGAIQAWFTALAIFFGLVKITSKSATSSS